MKWTQPVYWAQILTGVAGIGAVLVADDITKWHLLVSAILATCIVVSLLVVARAEADADRNRSHLNTLLRAMELPYFIIKAITNEIELIANRHNWQITQQENFQKETVYQFRASDGQLGRVVMATQEFKDLWILDMEARSRALEARLFRVDQATLSQTGEEFAGVVIREAISCQVNGPHWVSQSVQTDGTRLYQLRLDKEAKPIKTVSVPKQRFDELLSMVPIRRYQELAMEVERVFSGHHE
ncbi:MAG: hypothetical protein KDB22_23955 [Planctomycetales bacterium]|nr:hypothetical protein [Planctomycetales bacterium]